MAKRKQSYEQRITRNRIQQRKKRAQAVTPPSDLLELSDETTEDETSGKKTDTLICSTCGFETTVLHLFELHVSSHYSEVDKQDEVKLWCSTEVVIDRTFTRECTLTKAFLRQKSRKCIYPDRCDLPIKTKSATLPKCLKLKKQCRNYKNSMKELTSTREVTERRSTVLRKRKINYSETGDGNPIQKKISSGNESSKVASPSISHTKDQMTGTCTRRSSQIASLPTTTADSPATDAPVTDSFTTDRLATDSPLPDSCVEVPQRKMTLKYLGHVIHKATVNKGERSTEEQLKCLLHKGERSTEEQLKCLLQEANQLRARRERCELAMQKLITDTTAKISGSTSKNSIQMPVLRRLLSSSYEARCVNKSTQLELGKGGQSGVPSAKISQNGQTPNLEQDKSNMVEGKPKVPSSHGSEAHVKGREVCRELSERATTEKPSITENVEMMLDANVHNHLKPSLSPVMKQESIKHVGTIGRAVTTRENETRTTVSVVRSMDMMEKINGTEIPVSFSSKPELSKDASLNEPRPKSPKIEIPTYTCPAESISGHGLVSPVVKTELRPSIVAKVKTVDKFTESSSCVPDMEMTPDSLVNSDKIEQAQNDSHTIGSLEAEMELAKLRGTCSVVSKSEISTRQKSSPLTMLTKVKSNHSETEFVSPSLTKQKKADFSDSFVPEIITPRYRRYPVLCLSRIDTHKHLPQLSYKNVEKIRK